MPNVRIKLALGVLAVTHGAVVLAGFFAPYSPETQNRQFPFVPPSCWHMVDSNGAFHIRPFVYPWKQQKGRALSYEEDRSCGYPIHFWASGAPFQLLGMVTLRRHLFGVDEPARLFLLGTDGFGRDVFSRVLWGGQISLLSGVLATIIALTLGLSLGALAGFFGNWVDDAFMRLAEVFLALPWLYFLFTVRAFFPPQISPNKVFLLLICCIGIIGWAQPARLIRGVVLTVREREHVLAARGFGASSAYLLRRHILPEVLSVAFTQAGVYLPRYVLAEVVLSFFGLGVSEPTPSWGNMLAELRHYNVLTSYWWMFGPTFVLIPISLSYQSVFSYDRGNKVL